MGFEGFILEKVRAVGGRQGLTLTFVVNGMRRRGRWFEDGVRHGKGGRNYSGGCEINALRQAYEAGCLARSI